MSDDNTIITKSVEIVSRKEISHIENLFRDIDNAIEEGHGEDDIGEMIINNWGDISDTYKKIFEGYKLLVNNFVPTLNYYE